MRRARAFLQRSPAERRLLACAVLLQGGAWLLLRCVRFGPLCRGGAWFAARVPAARADAAREQAVLWAASTAAALLPFRRGCLPAALAAHWLLLAACRRESIVRFGVAGAPAAAFLGHAWLECDGRAVFGLPAGAAYLPLRTSSHSRNHLGTPETTR